MDSVFVLPSLTRQAVIDGPEDLQRLWNKQDVLLLPDQPSRMVKIGYAASDTAVEAAKRLRYLIFNEELGEGFEESESTGLDQDKYDPQMTHLLMLDPDTDEVHGTYRLQTVKHALAHEGIYSADEYDLTPLEPYFDDLVEAGRACVSRKFRAVEPLLALWVGLAHFMNMYDQHFLFGCSSLTSQDPDDGWRGMKSLRERGRLHDELMLRAHPEFSCGSPDREHDPAIGPGIKLPKLYRTYLQMGAKVISEPAIDRGFKTIDFLLLMDAREVSMRRFKGMVA